MTTNISSIKININRTVVLKSWMINDNLHSKTGIANMVVTLTAYIKERKKLTIVGEQVSNDEICLKIIHFGKYHIIWNIKLNTNVYAFRNNTLLFNTTQLN